MTDLDARTSGRTRRTPVTAAVSGSDPVPSAVDTDASTEGISAPVVAALARAWVQIRARHPEVPAVVVILGAGSIGVGAGGLRLGHFAATRWHRADTRLPEVFIGGEGLAHGPAAVLGTLLHEAAHALAHVRGIKDTSRQGRWHNARFRALAGEVGIEVTKDPRLGWSPTTVTDHTRGTYTDTVDELGHALRIHRTAEARGGPGAGKSASPPPCVCDCGRRIRVAPTVLAAAPITCGRCGTEFAPAPGGG